MTDELLGELTTTTHLCDSLPDSPYPIQPLPLVGKLKEKAMHLYYQGIFPTEIIELLNIRFDDLALAVFGADRTGNHPDCWAYKKLCRPSVSIVSYEKVKSIALRKPEAKLVAGITRKLQQMEDNNAFVNMDMDDMSKAVSMIEKLDRVGRLEESKATQHIASERRTYSLREIAEQGDGINGDTDEIVDLSNEDFRTRERDNPEDADPDEGDSSGVSTACDGRGWHPRDIRSKDESKNTRIFEELEEPIRVQE